jgi:uncharacterized RDD family membrane protein YckC
MADEQQNPPSGPNPAPGAGSTPPQPDWSGAPAAWPAPPPQPAPGAWPAPPVPPAPGAWAGYPPQQPGYPPQQQGYPGAYPPPPGYPPQPGYPPPGYGQPMGYPPAGYGAMPQYAGFWIRFVAYFIDAIIWVVALFVAALSIIILVGLVLLPAVFFGYWWYFWWKGGATPGMKMVGLRVVRAIDGGPLDGGMAAIRALIFYVEMFLGLIGLIGFIWAAFEPRKRAWHDMAAGTVVIHTN